MLKFTINVYVVARNDTKPTKNVLFSAMLIYSSYEMK